MTPDTITHGSGFHGYGGTGMAVRQVLGDLDTRWVFDIKPAAAALISQHLPGVENLGDMTAVWPLDRAPGREVEPVLVRTDSWPCQPHSPAGQRLGEADPRALWPNVARSIAVTRPAVWFGENVARCVSNGELARVVASLTGMGYVLAWATQRADTIGACHRRNRLFVVAVDLRHPDLDLVLARLLAQPWWTGGVPAAQLAPLAPLLPTPTTRNGRGPDLRGPRSDGGGCAPDLQTVAVGLAAEPERFGHYTAAVARHATMLGRPAPDPTMVGVRGKPQLNPWFVEWMMCLPHGHVAGVEHLGQVRPVSWRPRALSLLGDGVVPAQAGTAYRRLVSQVLDQHLGLRHELAS